MAWITDLKALKQRVGRAINAFSYAYSSCSEGALAQVCNSFEEHVFMMSRVLVWTAQGSDSKGLKRPQEKQSAEKGPPFPTSQVWMLEEEESKIGRASLLTTKVSGRAVAVRADAFRISYAARRRCVAVPRPEITSACFCTSSRGCSCSCLQLR